MPTGVYKRKHLPLAVRFFASVREDGACLLWTASRDQRGYGYLWAPSRGRVKAHRLSYLMFVGPIPEGFGVLHRCDVPSCVRPEHLFVGTQRDNMMDAFKKGRVVPWPSRNYRGEQNGKSLLTSSKVREIRVSPEACSSLARRFGVSPSTIRAVRSRQNWARFDMISVASVCAFFWGPPTRIRLDSFSRAGYFR